MMKRSWKRKWLIGGIVTLVIPVGLLVLNSFSPPEPAYQGRPLTAWARGLGSPDPLVRSNATEALRKMGPQAVPFLVDALRKRDPILKRTYLSRAHNLPAGLRRTISRVFGPFNTVNDRLAAVQALGVIGTNAPVTPLVKALRDPDRQVSSSAVTALSAIGRPAVPALVESLEDRDGYARSMACYVLSLIGPQAWEAVPALIRRFTDPENNVPSQAASALGRIGRSALPALLEALRSPDERTRSMAAKAIGGLGPPAKDSVPALIAATKDPSAVVRQNAVETLARWAYLPETVAALTEALNDTDGDARLKALLGLAKTGRRAEPAVPVLVKRLDDERWEVRAWAARVLGQIGPAAKSAVPKLRERSNDQSLSVRANAEEAVQKIAAASAPQSKSE